MDETYTLVFTIYTAADTYAAPAERNLNVYELEARLRVLRGGLAVGNTLTVSVRRDT